MINFRCPNCGKKISTSGNVCPYCQFEKRAHAKQAEMTGIGGCLGIIAGAVIGVLLSGVILGVFLGFVGGVTCAVAARIASAP